MSVRSAMAKLAKGDTVAADYAYERHVLNGELNRWGHWIERHSDYAGYPGVNILAAYIGGDGGAKTGHRILCLDMPWEIEVTHLRVLTCTEAEQEAVWIRHVVRLKEDGTLWSLYERLIRVGITEDTYRRRYSRARQRIMGVVPIALMSELSV